jgi:hypothetical protein
MEDQPTLILRLLRGLKEPRHIGVHTGAHRAVVVHSQEMTSLVVNGPTTHRCSQGS